MQVLSLLHMTGLIDLLKVYLIIINSDKRTGEERHAPLPQGLNRSFAGIFLVSYILLNPVK